jgi:hypothetical protein
MTVSGQRVVLVTVIEATLVHGGNELEKGRTMTLTVLDPRTGNHVTITVPDRPQSRRRARRWVLRELDRLDEQRRLH